MIHSLVETYASDHTSALNLLLEEVEMYTLKEHPHAHMLSGKVQGRLLQVISQMIQPRYVLEIGTFTGFSALCLTAGLLPIGELHTIEVREQDAQTAKAYFDRSDRSHQIQLHTGNALNIIPTLNFEWDLVFLDADKVNYTAYYEMVVPRMKQGGWLIADNVLFHGQVLEQPVTGKNALAIQEFNKHVMVDERTDQVMLTVRDGLLIVRKK